MQISTREAEQVTALVSPATSSLLQRSTQLLAEDKQTGTTLILQVSFIIMQYEFPQLNCTLISDDCTVLSYGSATKVVVDQS